MVESVIELNTDFQHDIFPTTDLRVLHNAEICIEIVRIAEVIASLSEGNQGTSAGASRARQVTSIKSSFATRLHESRTWIGGCPVG